MSGSSPLIPPEWDTLSPLLDVVLDAPPDRRAALIEELTAGHAARGDALRALVSECERGLPLLDRSAGERFGALAVDDSSLLPPVVADRYRIGHELGRGGMARVYLAHDLKHGRDVAIKVLRPELSQSLGHDRFLREIDIAARLRHPNIVPLYDSGEVDGAFYFVMPYEEGRSLGDRLRAEGPLPVGDALGVLRDVARALAYAHEHGVVHRDVKSDNVMLSSDAAIVTDFGIAKAVSAALTDGGGTELTQTGSAIGTPAYMAPEQAAGDPEIDHRADIYAFGCLAYEVFTGTPPFHGLTKHQTVAAHLMTVPPAIGTVRPDVPPAAADLIARCLEKEPAARPQTARDVLRALDMPASASGAATPAAASLPRSGKPFLIGLGLMAALAAGGYLLTGSRESARPISIAVLPFFNTNADSATDFVGDGLADEVASALARVPGIQIKSRSGARLYQNVMAVDPIEAGAKLKAQYIMTALLRQERGRWILSADLTRATDATSIWDERFNLDPEQSPQVAHLVATSLVSGLQRAFPGTIGAAPALAATQRTTSSDAHRLWLGGQEKLSRRGQSVKESADLFRAAIREDSLFAGAWSGLSMSLVLFPHFQRSRVDEVRREVEDAARRALELDPTLAQPHVALGMLHQFDYQWDRAEANYQEAIRLEPRNVEARIQYTRHLLFRGRPADALSQVLVARAEDPASAVVLAWAAYAYFLDGQMDSALAESRRAVETDSTSIHVGMSAMIRAWLNRVDEALPLIDLVPTNYAVGGYLRAKYGDTSAARQMLQDLDAPPGNEWAAESRKAFTYLGLGDTAGALTALERATDAREIWGVWDPIASPIFDPVRQSPRFREIVRRIGLPDPATSGTRR